MGKLGVAGGHGRYRPGLQGESDAIGAHVDPQVSVAFGPAGRHGGGRHLAGPR
jgi:hypothetical protein